MGWIKERIEAEHRKHGSMPNGLEKFNLDWARLAEQKIIGQLKDNINGTKLGCWAGGITAKVEGKDDEALQEYTDKVISWFCSYLLDDLNGKDSHTVQIANHSHQTKPGSESNPGMALPKSSNVGIGFNPAGDTSLNLKITEQKK